VLINNSKTSSFSAYFKPPPIPETLELCPGHKKKGEETLAPYYTHPARNRSVLKCEDDLFGFFVHLDVEALPRLGLEQFRVALTHDNVPVGQGLSGVRRTGATTTGLREVEPRSREQSGLQGAPEVLGLATFSG